MKRDNWEQFGGLVVDAAFSDVAQRTVLEAINRFHKEELGTPERRDVEVGDLESLLGSRLDAMGAERGIYTEVFKLLRSPDPDDGVVRVLVEDFVKESAARKLAGIASDFDQAPAEYRSQIWDDLEAAALQVTDVREAIRDTLVEPLELRGLTSLESEFGERIPLGISPTLDEAMRGGPPVGKVGCIVAPPKVGKTQMLVNIGAEAIKRGYNVLHLTMEIDQVTLAKWYYAMLTDTAYDNLIPHQKEVLSGYEPGWGDLALYDYTGRSCNIGTVGRVVSRHLAQGRGLSVLLLDYLALLDRREENRYLQLGVELRQLRKLGTRHHFLALTAAQANRYAAIEGTTETHHIADSFEIPRVADFTLLLSQTREEKGVGLMRAQLADNRFGAENPMIELRVNYSTMKVWERR